MIDLWSIYDATLASKVAPLARMADVSTIMFRTPDKPQEKLAIVPLVGVMTPYGLSSPYLGSVGTSTKLLRQELEQLSVRSDVSAVLIYCDSPGGAVLGTPELGDAIYQLSAAKPTAVIVDGLCASAAMFAVSSARRIFATKGSVIGSIGVYSVVIDQAAMLESMGIKVIPITSSQLKIAGLPGIALTEEQRASLQRRIDTAFVQFRTTVQRARRISDGQMEMAANGEVFSAFRAKQLGLVDEVGTIHDAMAWLGFPSGIPQASKPKAATIESSTDQRAKFDRWYAVHGNR